MNLFYGFVDEKSKIFKKKTELILNGQNPVKYHMLSFWTISRKKTKQNKKTPKKLVTLGSIP